MYVSVVVVNVSIYVHINCDYHYHLLAVVNVLFTIVDRYGNTKTGTLIVQRCIGTEAKLYDCWYYSVDSRIVECPTDVAVECKQGECSLICENGGTLTTRCTCDCAHGFSGMNCSSE